MSDELFPIPMPSLVAVLKNRENAKGEPLTEKEVLDIRDACECRMGTVNEMQALEEARGYPDIDPERVWQQWLEFKSHDS